jgi:hypothetical protein
MKRLRARKYRRNSFCRSFRFWTPGTRRCEADHGELDARQQAELRAWAFLLDEKDIDFQTMSEEATSRFGAIFGQEDAVKRLSGKRQLIKALSANLDTWNPEKWAVILELFVPGLERIFLAAPPAYIVGEGNSEIERKHGQQDRRDS